MFECQLESLQGSEPRCEMYIKKFKKGDLVSFMKGFVFYCQDISSLYNSSKKIGKIIAGIDRFTGVMKGIVIDYGFLLENTFCNSM